MPCSYAVGSICVDGPSTVTLTAVEPRVQAGSVDVSAFSTTMATGYGDRASSSLDHYVQHLRAAMTAPVTHRVSTRCSDDDDQRSLAIQLDVAEASDLPVVVDRVTVRYRVDGHDRSITLHNRFTICSGTSRDPREDESGQLLGRFAALPDDGVVAACA